ncbi:MAG: hypothetical protein R3B46_05700 [Phycisphaerales bacterium]
MRIFLDDHAVSSSATTLSGALACVAEHVGDRLLIEAQADGRVLSADELTNPSVSDPYAQEMRFRSADPIALARVTLHDAGVAVGSLEGQHARTADLIETGARKDANEALTHIFSIWSQTLTALDMISRTPGIPWPPKGGVVDQPQIDSATTTLKGHLDEIKTTLNAGDSAGLCDILRYDMDGQATHWKSLCNNLADAMTDNSH